MKLCSKAPSLNRVYDSICVPPGLSFWVKTIFFLKKSPAHPTSLFGVAYIIMKKSLQKACFFQLKNLTLTH